MTDTSGSNDHVDLSGEYSEDAHWHDVDDSIQYTIQWRRTMVFLILSAIFIGSLAMLNIIGVTRFLDLSFTIPLTSWRVPMEVAVGVLPYPVTFLCTDLVCELYGRRHANALVGVGFLVNGWVAMIIWLGGYLPGTPSPEFFFIRNLTLTTMLASMTAYTIAQLVDVQLFHFWKRLTKGRHLWLRNNGSTLVSQWVDTTAIILIIYPTGVLPINESRAVWPQLLFLISSGYVFKLVAALLDTGPFYLATRLLRRYLRLPEPTASYDC